MKPNIQADFQICISVPLMASNSSQFIAQFYFFQTNFPKPQLLNFPAKHTTDEDKNKQIHSQIKIHNEHFKNITKIEKYKKKTEHDPSVHYLYTLPKNQKNVKLYNKKKNKTESPNKHQFFKRRQSPYFSL